MSGSILPNSLSQADHLKALDLMAEARLNALDLSCILIDLLDQVPSAALPALAVQFDVLGLKGWKFTTTIQDKRDLIKKSIELHRHKGTPWAIKEALKVIGVVGTTIIQEGIWELYDAQRIYDGSINYGGGGWANFRVIIDVMNVGNFNIADLEGLIFEYKNARSHLIDINFSANFTETVNNSEAEDLGIEFIQETCGPGALYNGVRTYNGVVNYDFGDYETLVVYNNNVLVTGII